MSAPTPAPGDDRPREGYYPDPSIPGYVRYWNGASWVPGTSRPAPRDGESLAPPPGAGTAQPASVEETGPHFFDEDPVEEPSEPPSAADAQHGSRPEPASAWGADRSRQSGFGGDQDRRVSWGAPQGAQGGDPRVSPAGRRPDGEAARTDGTANVTPSDQEANAAAGGSTFVFRRPTGQTGQPGGGAPADAPDDGTMTFRAVSPRTGPAGGGSTAAGGPGGPDRGAAGSGGNLGGPGFGPAGSGGGAAASGFGGQGGAAGSGFGPAGPGGDPAASGSGGQGGAAGSGFGPAGPGSGAAAAAFGGPPGAAGAAPSGPAFGGQAGPSGSGSGSAGPGFGAGKAAAARASAGQAGAGSAAAQASGAAPTALSGPQAAPTVPAQSGGPGSAQPGAAASSGTPLSAGPGGGQSSWAQQVHRLAGAGDEQPVTPWKPPVEDVFQAAARRQAEARPAGLGKRLVARLLDTVVLAALTAAAAVPLGTKAIDHVNEKIDAAKLSGETVTVWLLDGTTSVYLGIILAVLLLAGVLCEVLPTAKWGRTLGKKLMGLDVRDIEGHDSPGFGAALRRWLVYSVPGLLVVGIVGVAWCLFDRPWRQCWHDKAAHTFVAG
ncbi:RDD family protein [Streptomyces collinus]|uniref:RDD family protein n=1 Tax=Streptomyces collinus TaxID=42684 RepID=UPI0037B06186